MLFPKDKMSYTSVYEGKKSDEGWLVLNIAGIDLEGVSKIFVDLSDVEEIKTKKLKAQEALEEARRLLSGDL
ncbi:MAG: hypothetical protein K6U80_01875 [Firmicutes bacterium]|nr:hypothetical protein [Bacillota bacterium]